jgi:toxin ParE1/3/4
MVYLAEITPRAERDLDQIHEQINAGRSALALKWYRSLKQRLLRLEHYPKRCPVIRVQGKLRHLLYGRNPQAYRVIYRVLDKQKRVEILHIRHGARREPSRFDLFRGLYVCDTL